MTAILNDENTKNPTLICARTLRTLSTKFIILTLRSQMESFVEKMNANHIEVKDKEEDGFDVNVYFSNRRRMLRCTLSIFNTDDTDRDGSTSVCCRVSSSSYDDNNIFVHAQRISMKKILSSSLRFLSKSRLERLEKNIKSKLKRRNVKIAVLEPPCLMISTSHESIQVSVHDMSGELQVSDCETFSSRGRYERLLRETEMFPSKIEENIELFLDLITQTTGKKGIYEI